MFSDGWTVENGFRGELSSTRATEVFGEFPARGGGRDCQWGLSIDDRIGFDGLEWIRAVEVGEKMKIHSVWDFVEQVVCFVEILCDGRFGSSGRIKIWMLVMTYGDLWAVYWVTGPGFGPGRVKSILLWLMAAFEGPL